MYSGIRGEKRFIGKYLISRFGRTAIQSIYTSKLIVRTVIQKISVFIFNDISRIISLFRSRSKSLNFQFQDVTDSRCRSFFIIVVHKVQFMHFTIGSTTSIIINHIIKYVEFAYPRSASVNRISHTPITPIAMSQ